MVSNKDFYKQFDFYTKVYSISSGITKNVQNLFLRNYVIDRDITNNKIEISEDDKKCRRSGSKYRWSSKL